MTITRETSKGTLELTSDGNYITAYLNGSAVCTGVPGILPRDLAARLPGNYTHLLGGKVPLLAGEADILMDAKTPQPTPAEDPLVIARRERADLIAEIADADDEKESANRKAIKIGMSGGSPIELLGRAKEAGKVAEAARENLKKWDATHPLAETLRAERAAYSAELRRRSENS
jgi:hypothetical protein